MYPKLKTSPILFFGVTLLWEISLVFFTLASKTLPFPMRWLGCVFWLDTHREATPAGVNSGALETFPLQIERSRRRVRSPVLLFVSSQKGSQERILTSLQVQTFPPPRPRPPVPKNMASEAAEVQENRTTRGRCPGAVPAGTLASGFHRFSLHTPVPTNRIPTPIFLLLPHWSQFCSPS